MLLAMKYFLNFGEIFSAKLAIKYNFRFYIMSRIYVELAADQGKR